MSRSIEAKPPKQKSCRSILAGLGASSDLFSGRFSGPGRCVPEPSNRGVVGHAPQDPARSEPENGKAPQSGGKIGHAACDALFPGDLSASVYLARGAL